MALVPIDICPIGQIRQKTSGSAAAATDGASTGALTGVVGVPPAWVLIGAGVGSFGQPHTPIAAACAMAHCSNVKPIPKTPPTNCAVPQKMGVPKKLTSVPDGFVKTPPSRQILHGNRFSVGDAVGLAVGAAVGVAVGDGVGGVVGTGVGHGVGRGVGAAVGLWVGTGVGSGVNRPTVGCGEGRIVTGSSHSHGSSGATLAPDWMMLHSSRVNISARPILSKS
mmetsp:Transcript_8553/g.21359  ORF Transcript_8553/g.21359 Transcript_8553/m.21359 type:complete len:223 (+) Transcript_8553:3156-3824(+)